MARVRMRLHFWKPVVIHLSRDLHEAAQKVREHYDLDWFSITLVLEWLGGNSPLIGEAERLYRQHGEFYFRFSE